MQRVGRDSSLRCVLHARRDVARQQQRVASCGADRPSVGRLCSDPIDAGRDLLRMHHPALRQAAASARHVEVRLIHEPETTRPAPHSRGRRESAPNRIRTCASRSGGAIKGSTTSRRSRAGCPDLQAFCQPPSRWPRGRDSGRFRAVWALVPKRRRRRNGREVAPRDPENPARGKPGDGASRTRTGDLLGAIHPRWARDEVRSARFAGLSFDRSTGLARTDSRRSSSIPVESGTFDDECLNASRRRGDAAAGRVNKGTGSVPPRVRL
jgi:hypothetical protein